MSRTLSHRFPLADVPARNLSDLPRRTGYTLRTIQRWRVDGIPYWSADRVAIRLGVQRALAGTRPVKGSPVPSTTPAVTLRLPDATKHPLP